MVSALDCAIRDTADEQLAGDEVDDERYQTGEDGCRHVDVVLLNALD